MPYARVKNELPLIPGYASGDIASFSDGHPGAPLHEIAVNISSESGVSSVNVTRCGSNYAKFNAGSQTGAGATLTIANDGKITLSNASTARYFFPIFNNTNIKTGTYFFNVLVNGERYNYALTDPFRPYIAVVDNSGTAGVNPNQSFTIHEGLTAFTIYIMTEPNKTFNDDVIEISVTRTNTAADLETSYREDSSVSLGRTVTEGVLYAVSGKLHIGNDIYNTTPISVNAIEGINNVYAGAGTSEVTYIRRLDS